MNRKNRLLWMCWLAYTVSYIGRTGFSANLTPIIDHFGVTNEAAGLVGSFFFFAYACGQLAHGTLCKFYPKRYFISGALLVCALSNAVMFFEPAFGIYKYLWLFNGICLSVLWPSLIFTLSMPENSGDVKFVTFIMSTPTIIGKFFTYGVSALLNLSGYYRWFFVISAVISIATAVLWFCFFPKLNAGNDFERFEKKEKGAQSSKKNKIAGALVVFLIIIGITTAGNSLIKDGLASWVPKVLKDQYGTSDSLSIILSLVLPLCALCGTMLFLGLSKIIKNNFLLCGLIVLLCSAILVAIVLLTLPGTEIETFLPLLFGLGLIACLTEAINTLAVTKLPLELQGAVNSGMICGVMNACSYGGSTISSYALGSIADNGGWNAVFVVLLCVTIGMAVLLFGSFFVQKRKA